MTFIRRLYKFPHVWYGFVFVLVFLVNSGTLFHRFAFDDKSLIVDNLFLKNKPPLSTIFTTNYRAGSGNVGDGLYRPLVMISYIMNARQPLSPFPFHLFNVTVNALNSVLFCMFIFHLFKNLPLAVLSSILFGFHPIHTEAVANISGRPELIYVFFILLAWIIRERWLYSTGIFIMVVFLYVCGLLSKETAVMFPFMIIAYDILKNRPLFSLRHGIEYSVLALSTAAYLFWRWHLLGTTAAGLVPDFTDNPLYHVSFLSRIATAFGVYARYVGLLVAPLRLSADYSYNQIPVLTTFFHILPIFGIFLFFMAVVAAIVFRRHILIPFSIILILFPYILVSNIIFPVGTIMGERLLYLSAGGISLFTAFGILRLYEKNRAIAVFVFIPLMIFFTGKTVARNEAWYDDETLFSTDVKHAPNSVKILCNLGYLTGKAGNIEESKEYFRKAIDIYPEYTEALRGYGKRLYDQKRYEESLQYYARAVHSAPDDVNARNDYGIVLGKTGRLDEAEEQFAASIKLNPNSPLPYQEMSGICIDRGWYEKALDYLRTAERLGGDRRIILNNSAVAFYLLKDYSSAFQALKEAEAAGVSINEELAGAIRAAVQKR